MVTHGTVAGALALVGILWIAIAVVRRRPAPSDSMRWGPALAAAMVCLGAAAVLFLASRDQYRCTCVPRQAAQRAASAKRPSWGAGLDTDPVRTSLVSQERATWFELRKERLDGWTGQAAEESPNEDRFTQVAVGNWHSCGLRDDGTVTCWGRGSTREGAAPAGRFTHIAASGTRTCALDADREITCWGPGETTHHEPLGQLSLPQTYTDLDMVDGRPCARTVDGMIECWEERAGTVSVSPVPFPALAGSCGLTEAGIVACKLGTSESLEPFVLAVAEHGDGCGVHLDGSATCWTERRGSIRVRSSDLGPFQDLVLFEEGPLKDIHLIAPWACGLLVDGEIRCFGAAGSDLSEAPPGRFVQFDHGPYHGCGVRPNGSVTCWGDDTFGQSSPVDGTWDEPRQAAWREQLLQSVFDAEQLQHVYGAAVRFDEYDRAYVGCRRAFLEARESPRSVTTRATMMPHGNLAPVREDGEPLLGHLERPCFEVRARAAAPVPPIALSCSWQFQDRESPYSLSCTVETPDGTTEATREFAQELSRTIGQPVHSPRLPPPFPQAAPPDPATCADRAAWEPAPDFRTRQVAASPGHQQARSRSPVTVERKPAQRSFALKHDGSIVTWDRGYFGLRTVDEGPWSTLYAGPMALCATDGDGRLGCWWSQGLAPMIPNPAGDGPVRAVDVGERHLCAIEDAGDLVCVSLDDPDNRVRFPGPFDHVSVGRQKACALAEDETVSCWKFRNSRLGAPFIPDDPDAGDELRLPAPGGSFLQLDCGEPDTCGVRTDGVLVCWDREGSQWESAGPYTQVVADQGGCAVRANGTVDCWDSKGTTYMPTTRPMDRLGTGHATHRCALDPAGQPACWGCRYPFEGWGDCESPCNPPDVVFSEVSVGPGFSCGVTKGGGPRCWGYVDEPPWSRPRGL